MSIWGRHVSMRLTAVGALLLLAGALVPAMVRPPAREITLVARGMAFYLEDDAATPNPTITVAAGERVRIVLRNEDRGLTHDLSVPGLRVRSRLVSGNESAPITIDVPATPGTYENFCTPHRPMMAGTLVVAGG